MNKSILAKELRSRLIKELRDQSNQEIIDDYNENCGAEVIHPSLLDVIIEMSDDVAGFEQKFEMLSEIRGYLWQTDDHKTIVVK
jgi:hypothetical protein